MIRVAVVDDQPLLVSAFAALVDAQPDMEVVGTGADGREAVALCAGTDVDVLLLDIRMPVLDGVEATRLIVDAGPLPRVVILTLHDVTLTPKAPTKAGTAGSGQLVLQGTVKTYRYLDDDESAAAATKAGAKK